MVIGNTYTVSEVSGNEIRIENGIENYWINVEAFDATEVPQPKMLNATIKTPIGTKVTRGKDWDENSAHDFDSPYGEIVARDKDYKRIQVKWLNQPESFEDGHYEADLYNGGFELAIYNESNTIVKKPAEKTFMVTESFIKLAHRAACSDWKARIEKQVPDLFPDFIRDVLSKMENPLKAVKENNAGTVYVKVPVKSGDIDSNIAALNWAKLFITEYAKTGKTAKIYASGSEDYVYLKTNQDR